MILDRAPIFLLSGMFPFLDQRPPHLAPRVVAASAAQRLIACLMTTKSFSRMHVSARSQCRTPEPETDDLAPRSAEGVPTLARRAVAASAIQRVISFRVAPCVAHRFAGLVFFLV